MLLENPRHIIILLVILLAVQQALQSRRVLKLTSLKCEALDRKFGEFTLCQMKPIKRDVTEVSVRANLYQKPVDNVTISGALYKRGFESQRPLYEFNVDACAFMRNKRRNPFAAIVYKTFGFEKYSNMNHTCPYDHDLIFENFRFDPEHIALIPVPNGRYLVRLRWTVYNTLKAITVVTFQIFETTV